MTSNHYIGLMSGTSLDGVDVALTQISNVIAEKSHIKVLQTHFVAFPETLRKQLLTLHHPSDNELEVTALVANTLARLYADAVNQLLSKYNINPADIAAIGCHGQTIRHRPELGFTLQIGNAALLAELTQITVVSDFRSRDIAAGGQGAPLVPAFHEAIFADANIHRVVINIGGIANLTNLPINGLDSSVAIGFGSVIGFDTGPGNMLMDAWAMRHLGVPYDESGKWAATGNIIQPLLDALLAHPYFTLIPPKSTGRDLFNMDWLTSYLQMDYAPADVQRTLLELTAVSIADAVNQYCGIQRGEIKNRLAINPAAPEIYLCGGGAHNNALIESLKRLLPLAKITSTDKLGISVNWVEAAAFAWLARQTMHQATSNLPAVTGAAGPRILGAIYAR